jgi:hypothetical protein
MADLNARIKPKKSSTTGEVPQAADLEVAELAVNTADGKLFVKHTDDSIKEISGGGGLPAVPVSGEILASDGNNWESVDISTLLSGGVEPPLYNPDIILNFEGSGDIPVLTTTGMTTTFPSTDAKFGTGGATFSRASADFLQASWPSGTLGTQTFTLSFWVKSSDTNYSVNTGRRIMAPVSGTNLANGFQVIRNTAGGGTYTPHADDAQGAIVLTPDGTAASYLCGTRTQNVADGNWHYIVIQHEGGGVYSCFFDGNLTERRTAASPIDFADNGGFFLGKRSDNSAEGYFDGSIDNFALKVGTVLSNVSTVPVPTGPVEVVVGYGLGGAIDSLNNVSASSPTDGQVLTWVDANNQWEPATPSGGGGAVDSVNGQTGVVSLDVYDMTNVGLSPGSGPVDPSFSNTPLLLHCEGTQGGTSFVNSGSVGGVGTATSAITDQTQPKFGSASMDANGGYVDFAFDDAYNVNGGDFTIESWLWFEGPLSNRVLISLGNTTSDYAYSFYFTSSAAVFLETTDGSTVTSYVFSWTPGTSQWYHVALCRDGSNLRFFVDGTQVDTTKTISNTIYTETDGTLRVGASLSGSVPFPGYIDEVRLTTGVARYTTNFTAPTEAFPEGVSYEQPTDGQVLGWVDANSQWEPVDAAVSSVNGQTGTVELNLGDINDVNSGGGGGDPHYSNVALLLRGNGTVGSTVMLDEGPSSRSPGATLGAIVNSSTESKYGGQSIRFPAEANYFRFNNTNGELRLGADDFTIEWWWRTDSAITQNTYCFATGVVGSQESYGAFVGTNGLNFRYSTNGSSISNVTAAWTPSIDTWYHIAIVRSNNELMMFVDGTQIGSTTPFSFTLYDFSVSSTLGFGGIVAGGNPVQGFIGYMDDFRLTKGVARYTANFTTPLELPAEGGIVLADGQVLAWVDANSQWEPGDYVSKATLQAEVAAATDFADFQARIAAL